jgi:hypothetical protein
MIEIERLMERQMDAWLTRACSMSRQKRMAFPTSLRLWKTSVLSSAYSMMSFSWWWKNSRIPEQRGRNQRVVSRDCAESIDLFIDFVS